MLRGVYLTRVPDDVMEKLDKLKLAGLDFRQVMIYATKKFLEKPLNEVALEVFGDMIAPELGVVKKEAEPGV